MKRNTDFTINGLSELRKGISLSFGKFSNNFGSEKLLDSAKYAQLQSASEIISSSFVSNIAARFPNSGVI